VNGNDLTFTTAACALTPGYGSSPALGGTITMTTTPGVPVTSTVVISETGTANLTINTYSTTGGPQISVAGPGVPFTINDGGGSQTLTLTCNNEVTGTFSGTLTVTHNATGSPATYTVNCNINSVLVATTNVPTLNEWGMVLFMLLAGFASLQYLKRQKSGR
jgi:hypothetical protein